VPLPITVVILTLDEEENLPACLESAFGWASDVVVVDSGSTDRTRDVAESHGARVVTHAFESHARQWEWVLASVALSTEWVMGLDADQRVTSDLREDLERRFCGEARGASGLDGFYVNRRQIFRGRWIRFGGYYPKYLLKVFRKDRVRMDPLDLVDHHFHVSGRTAKLRGDLIEDNRKESDLGFWITKHVGYARRQAREEFLRRSGAGERLAKPRPLGSPDQRVAWMKRAWSRFPLYLRPALYFLYRYVARLGILDGRQGLVFHFLHAFWYRLLVDVFLEELLSGPPNAESTGSRRPG
jgi:glycosyltransferase involved in cell wall biosynthesis